MNYKLSRPPAGSKVKIIVRTGIPTDYVPPPYPSIFEFLPLEGTFQWTLSWEGHPSGQFTFRTLANLKKNIISTLTPGAEFTAWGVGFRINNLSITEIPATQQPLRLIQISVSLGGKHENYVDRVVPLRKSNSSSNLDNIPDCLNDLTEAQQESLKLVFKTSVSELAKRAGDRFTGPSMPVTIPGDTPSTEGTTFLSKAQEQVRMNGCFVRYSRDTAVEAIRLNSVSTWTFQETDLRSQVSSTVAGTKRKPFLGASFRPPVFGSVMPSAAITPPIPVVTAENISIYPYVNTYEPTYRLEGAFIEYLSLYEDPLQNSPVYLVPTWKRKEPVRRETQDGDENPGLPPPNTGTLKDLSNLFSASGITKTRKTTITENDQPVTEILVRWGFVFLARDIYQGEDKTLVGVNGNNYWRKVEEKYTTYHYDSRSGYLLGSTTTGWELIRYKEESLDEENTATLSQSDPDEAKRIALFEYFQNPYHKLERYVLEAHSTYYKDRELPYNICKVLLPSGRYKISAKNDPTFVEPYFAKISTTYENNFKAIKDPAIAAGDPEKILTTGKESYHRNIINILKSKNTKKNESENPFEDDGSGEDAFNTYESQFSASDALYSNSLEQTTFKRDSGRPSTHTRKAPRYILLDPSNSIGIPIQGKNRKNYFAYTSTGNYSDTGGLLSGAPQGGSLSYPAAKTLKEAQKAAETEITIQNMRDCLQESFTIPFSPNIREGDRLTYTCNGEIRRRRVLSISHEVEIKGTVNGTPIITSKGSQVSCGLERETPVEFKSERKPRYNDTRFNNPNTLPLGGIVDLQVQTRRNF